MQTAQEPEQSYLVSMGDMLSGLLFLFIITLVLFSLRLKDTQVDLAVELRNARAELEQYRVLQSELESRLMQIAAEKEQLELDKRQLEALLKQLSGGRAVRDLLFLELQAALGDDGTRIEVDLEHGILRLPEEVLFPSGSAELRPEGLGMLRKLSEALREVLPRFVWNENRETDVYALTTVEAIFVEGHTDNVATGDDSAFDDNWELSTARAIRTFKSLLGHEGSLDQFTNESGTPLFSVSGYADRRPVAANTDEDGRRHNRRIDLRFIMSPPKLTPEAVLTVEKQLGVEYAVQ